MALTPIALAFLSWDSIIFAIFKYSNLSFISIFHLLHTFLEIEFDMTYYSYKNEITERRNPPKKKKKSLLVATLKGYNMNSKSNKNIYYNTRTNLGLTREAAVNKMDTISVDRLEKIENNRANATPDDIVELASAYNEPTLCNYYCMNECAIGQSMNLALEVPELPNIVLETVASLNDINPYVNELISIARDGNISDEEIPKFAKIQYTLEEVALSISTLNAWIEKTKNENGINADIFDSEIRKLAKS